MSKESPFRLARPILPPETPISGTGHSLGEFWAWAYSDVLMNTVRPVIAEYIVGCALDCLEGARLAWDAVDLTYRGHPIEVKSSGFVQAWSQQKLSRVTFDIAPKKYPWDARTNTTLAPGRTAHCYVFCVHLDRDSADATPLATERWQFYVLAASEIEWQFTGQKRVSLARLQSVSSPVVFSQLRSAVDATLKGGAKEHA